MENVVKHALRRIKGIDLKTTGIETDGPAECVYDGDQVPLLADSPMEFERRLVAAAPEDVIIVLPGLMLMDHLVPQVIGHSGSLFQLIGTNKHIQIDHHPSAKGLIVSRIEVDTSFQEHGGDPFSIQCGNELVALLPDPFISDPV
jgi:hypothetical protein